MDGNTIGTRERQAVNHDMTMINQVVMTPSMHTTEWETR